MSTRIALVSAHDLSVCFRQTPNGLGTWDRYRFVANDADAETLVVFDNLGDDFNTCAPRSRRILVVTEPPGIRRYASDFLSQFGLILSPYPLDGCPVPVRMTQTGLPWFFGLRFDGKDIMAALSFEELAHSRPQAKDARLSVVCSTKSRLPRHRERLAFVMALKARLQDRLVIRGRGFHPVHDKSEAIAPHRYHLVLENNDLGCFWTEKLADAYLGWSLPLYAGARRAMDDFPSGSMVYLDLSSVPSCIEQVERVLDEDPYESCFPSLVAAREKLLYHHNFFALLSREIDVLEPSGSLALPDVIRPSGRRTIWKTISRIAREGMTLRPSWRRT